jgi:hypothetical protein
MSAGPQRPTVGTAGGSDMGARMARLQDLIEHDARGAAHGLPAVFHEVAAVGAMHAPGEDDIVLVTLVNTAGESHVFALDKGKAAHFREQLVDLRHGVRFIASKTGDPRRTPITKSGGRML